MKITLRVPRPKKWISCGYFWTGRPTVRILPGVNGLFRLALKDWDEEKALSDSPMPLWTPVMGLLGRRTSRNKMDADRRDPSYAANVMALARQTDRVDGEAIFYYDYSEAEFETVYIPF